MRSGLLAAALLLALAGCETLEGALPAASAPETAQAEPAPAEPREDPAAALPAPTQGAGPEPVRRAPLERPPELDAPDIYMALQPDSTGNVSVVFAIDRARDNTPSDDPAIRLTPETGQCNPQQLRRFDFPDIYAGRPIYSALDAREKVGARELPAFLSTAVTTEMIRAGLARDPDDTRPQNICSFLLWQRLVDADYQAQLAAGQ